MRSPRRRGATALAKEEPTPLGINLAVGPVAVVAAAWVAAAFPAADLGWRFAVVSLAVGGVRRGHR
jgi:hypothetical protein